MSAEKKLKGLASHRATQATIDELRRRGFTVEVREETSWSLSRASRKADDEPAMFWIRADVHGNRLRTIAREVEGPQA